jgi:hypothetical protein
MVYTRGAKKRDEVSKNGYLCGMGSLAHRQEKGKGQGPKLVHRCWSFMGRTKGGEDSIKGIFQVVQVPIHVPVRQERDQGKYTFSVHGKLVNISWAGERPRKGAKQ